MIAWLWARTVRSPNPAANGAMVPLVSSFMLSTKEGKQAWVEIAKDANDPDGYRFEVRTDGKSPAEAKNGTKSSRGANFTCVLTGAPISPDYIKAEGKAKRMGARLMAIVAEGQRGRAYLAPTSDHEKVAASSAEPAWRPEQSLPHDPRNFWTVDYGLTTFGDLFTPRQLVALTTFSDLVGEAREKVAADAHAAGLDPDPTPLADGGRGAEAYADAVAVYLAFAVDRVVDRHTTIATWDSSPSKLQLRNTFARQAIPMTWDFAEGNPFSMSSGTWTPSVEWVSLVLQQGSHSANHGRSVQSDAADSLATQCAVVSTDPPYYDNIGYADLSDFFYVWLRRTLADRFPKEFATLLVPKAQELVATPYRHGGKEEAEEFFMAGMSRALRNIERASTDEAPVTIYYAFKQSEVEREGVTSTGWATFLEAALAAGFQVDGTWPVRTELGNRMIGRDTNALASSIVLVCRKRPADAATITRAEILRALKRELPVAVRKLQASAIAPVDMAQAAIGPGMAVFSRYAAVLESNDSPMPVRTALALINQELDAILASEDADYDPHTRFAVAWFEQHGYEKGRSGDADGLARAKNVGLNGLAEAGIFEARAGVSRLLRRDELPEDWDPAKDRRSTVWEATQHLIRRHEAEGLEGAADLLARLPGAMADAARELAYRLYQVCERRKWASEALPYNALVADWPEIQKRVASVDTAPPQSRLAV